MHQIIILANDKEERTNQVKALSKIKGTSILERLLDSIEPICSEPTIIIGYNGCEIIMATKNKYHYVWQNEPLGTAHAVLCAKKDLMDKQLKNIIVIPGDRSFISERTIKELINSCSMSNTAFSLATFFIPDFEAEDYRPFFFYQRIIKQKDRIKAIINFEDASEKEKLIQEINAKIYCFESAWLWENIDKLGNRGEYHLDEMIDLANSQNKIVNTVRLTHILEGLNATEEENKKIVEKYLA